MSETPQIGIPTARELEMRLKASSEDCFVERKTFGDWKGDALKTLVAFGNSTPIGYPAVLYIGVRDDGTPEQKTENLDKIQKTLADVAANIYPPLYYFPRVITIEGVDVLAIIVPGSDKRPHFAGQSYVRIGSKSIKASEQHFNELIAQRNSTAYELSKWKGKKITLSRPQQWHQNLVQYFTQDRILEDYGVFYITVSPGTGNPARESFPLASLRLSYDHKMDRLTIHITDATLAISC
jgi:predicted HTH transcriptional regulator